MNKRVMTNNPLAGMQSGTDYFGILICGALFICGSVVGTASAGFAAGNGFSDYLSGYLQLAGDTVSGGRDFLAALFGACKYHIAAVFFGFSILGVICLPVLSAVRGFFLCFSISAIVRHFGGDGVFLALAASGITALLTVPCFFLLTVQSFSSSLRLLQSVSSRGLKGALSPYGASFFRRSVACFAVLACSALIDTLLVPGLVIRIAEKLA